MTRAPYLVLPGLAAATADTATSVPDFVAHQLREAILSGLIQADALLRQEDVGQRLGVSRPPVREALKLLEAEGLVMSRPRRGYVVASLDLADIEEVFDIRMVLEAQAAFHAAQKRTQADLLILEGLVCEMETIHIDGAESGVRFSLLNREFHACINQAGGRKLSAQLLLTLRNKVERYVRLGSLIAGNVDRVNREHRQILEACRAKDATLMAQLCQEHVRETGRRLIQALGENRRAEGGARVADR
jgi:DNA-binding GntR family transcriptional regulator